MEDSYFDSALAKAYYSHADALMRRASYDVLQFENEKYILVINAVGVNPSDIKINFLPSRNFSSISVVGETKNEMLRENFSVKILWYVKKEIKEINKEFVNGLVILEIEFENNDLKD